MDKIESLIKHLNELKEELNKNVNMSYGSEQNVVKEEMEKDSADPKWAPKEVKVKQLKAQVQAGTYKPDSHKIADKMLSNPDHPKSLSVKDVHKLIKEELSCSENGQWNLKVN